MSMLSVSLKMRADLMSTRFAGGAVEVVVLEVVVFDVVVVGKVYVKVGPRGAAEENPLR
jgi:hypothetical protein